MSAFATLKSSLKNALRPLVPEWFVNERGAFLRLGPRAGKIYLKLRFLDTVGIRTLNQGRAPASARSFLFICYGNIMRSPMAELMLLRALAARGHREIMVRSAGIHAVPGTEAHPRAQVAARELGLPLDNHRSQLLTREMIAEADAVLAMDFRNKAELMALFPEARNKIFLLSAYADGSEIYREIRDPFFGDQDEARRCYRTLQTCIDNLATSLALISTESPPILAGGAESQRDRESNAIQSVQSSRQ